LFKRGTSARAPKKAQRGAMPGAGIGPLDPDDTRRTADGADAEDRAGRHAGKAARLQTARLIVGADLRLALQHV